MQPCSHSVPRGRCYARRASTSLARGSALRVRAREACGEHTRGSPYGWESTSTLPSRLPGALLPRWHLPVTLALSVPQDRRLEPKGERGERVPRVDLGRVVRQLL